MKSGIQLMLIERKEQIEKHGRTVIKDVSQNNNGQLLDAAIHLTGKVGGIGFPSHWDKKICEKMETKTKIEKLVIAGALIAAEIDRLQLLEK